MISSGRVVFRLAASIPVDTTGSCVVVTSISSSSVSSESKQIITNETILFDLFVISIILSKLNEMVHKLEFIYVYIFHNDLARIKRVRIIPRIVHSQHKTASVGSGINIYKYIYIYNRHIYIYIYYLFRWRAAAARSNVS